MMEGVERRRRRYLDVVVPWWHGEKKAGFVS
jgi:hypothetical protein